jgi:hypothetical protein
MGTEDPAWKALVQATKANKSVETVRNCLNMAKKWRILKKLPFWGLYGCVCVDASTLKNLHMVKVVKT